MLSTVTSGAVWEGCVKKRDALLVSGVSVVVVSALTDGKSVSACFLVCTCLYSSAFVKICLKSLAW